MPSAAFSNRERIRLPDVLVQRHAALAGRALDHDAGAEDGVGFARQQRGQDLGQRLGCVLPVAVEHHDDVEPVLDGQVVARPSDCRRSRGWLGCLIRVMGRSEICW